MAVNFMLPLRIVQALLAVLAIALTAYVASWYNMGSRTSPPQVNFLLFCGVWSAVIAVPYLTLAPRLFPAAAHKFGILAVEAITMLSWFAGFITIAVFISSLTFCRGNVCKAAQAAIVVGGIEWALFMATTIMASIHALRTRGSSAEKQESKMEVHSTA